MRYSEHIEFDISSDMISSYGSSNLPNGITIGSNPFAMHGPYATLKPGKWSITVSGTADPVEDCYVDVCVSGGKIIMARVPWKNGTNQLDIHLPFPGEYLEIRVFGRRGTHIRIDAVSAVQIYSATSRRSFSEYHRMGMRLILDPSSLVDRDIITKGSWETECLEYLKLMAHKHSNHTNNLIFLDIGAYFGLYSMVMAQTNLFERVIAFEFDKLNLRQLHANLLLNDPNCFIETHNVAVSDESGHTTVSNSLEHPDGNRGGIGVAPHGTTVRKDRLDNLVKLENRSIFAKIDVEGHELSVLRGMESTLQSNKMVLQIEDFLDGKEISHFLKENGYQLINKIKVDYFYSNF